MWADNTPLDGRAIRDKLQSIEDELNTLSNLSAAMRRVSWQIENVNNDGQPGWSTSFDPRPRVGGDGSLYNAI